MTSDAVFVALADPELLELLTQNGDKLTKLFDLLSQVYVLQLFVVGCVSAVFVCLFLYKFIKIFM